MKLNRKLTVIISGVLVLLTAVTVYFIVSKDTEKDLSYKAYTTDEDLVEPPADYTDNKKIFAQDKTLYIYLGSGSGANTGEVASVTRSAQRTTVHVNANYCGATRDNQRLWVAVEFPEPVNTYKPIKADVNSTCGTVPKDLKLKL